MNISEDVVIAVSGILFATVVILAQKAWERHKEKRRLGYDYVEQLEEARPAEAAAWRESHP